VEIANKKSRRSHKGNDGLYQPEYLQLIFCCVSVPYARTTHNNWLQAGFLTCVLLQKSFPSNLDSGTTFYRFGL